MRVLLNSFTSGVLSPLTVGLTDLEGTRKGCRTLKNFQVLPSGGVVRRPGLIHEQAAHAGQPIVVGFNYSATDAFILEIGDGYFRVLDEDGDLVVTPTPPPVGALSVAGAPLRYAAPWTEEQLDRIQWVQANNLLLFFHPDVPPHQIVRVAQDDWRLTPVEWRFPPLRDQNVSTTTLACSVTAVGATGTLTASAPTFNPDQVGGVWQVTHVRTAPIEKLNFPLSSANVTSAAMRVIGKWEIFSVGEWTGTLALEQEIAPGVWETLRTWQSERDYNVQTSGQVEVETIMRLKFTGTGFTASGSVPAPRAQLTAIDPAVKGLVKITGYTSPTVVSVQVMRALHATSPTTRWSEAAFSAARGYPRTACFHDQRLVLGGVASLPLTVWGSLTADLFNFERTGLDDGSWTYELAATESSPIAWIFSQARGLIVATEAEEWLMQGGEGKPITPTSIEAMRKTAYGSDPQRVVLAGGAVIYVQSGGYALREYVFDFATQNFVSPDILELADHLPVGGIRCVAYAKKPVPTLYVVTWGGRLLSCTYRRAEGGTMVAWSEHVTDGYFTWVSVLYNEDEADDVWFVIHRDGAASIERFSPNHLQAVKAATAPEILVHLDAAATYYGSPTSTMTGLGHLIGRPVRILADGAEHPPQTVPGDGTLTLEAPASTIIVGLPYESCLQPMPWDVSMEDGPSSGRTVKAGPVSVLFYKSGACQYADSPAGPWRDVVFRANQDATDSAVPLFSGWRRLTPSAAFRDTIDVTVRTDGPLPLNLLALSPTAEIYGA